MGIRVTKIKGRAKPWRVTATKNKERTTRHFATREAAERYRRDLAGDEMLGEDLAVTPEERLALARLRAAGITTADLLRIASNAPARPDAPPLHAAATEYLADCRARNLRPATVTRYRNMLARFCRGREGELPSHITRDSVLSFLLYAYQSDSSRQTARTPLLAFLRWCARKGYADPSRWREPIKWDIWLNDEHSIGILRPGQVRVLLNRLAPRLRLPLALCCLTGIRPKGELERLRWEHVDFRARTITLPGSVTKTRQGRVLADLPPVVWDWLRAYRGEGKILPITYRHFRAAIRKAMAGQRAAKSKRGRPARKEIPPVGRWPHDATRHSFASYAYHTLGIERTIEIMGHVGGYGLFAKRYKACARAWTARLWFTIKPRKRKKT